MNLKFKKGQRSNLDNVSIDPGTIYLTEDTQSLFVDDINLLRFQLNDIRALRFEIEEEDIEFEYE